MMLDGERGWAAYVLERYARVCAARGDYRRAAYLFGAASTMPQSEEPFLMLARSAPAEQDLAAARLALGETEFAVAWGDGRAMTLEQALEDALAEEAD
jgi:hypothetical protein